MFLLLNTTKKGTFAIAEAELEDVNSVRVKEIQGKLRLQGK